MDIITVKDKSFKPYISEEDLQALVKKVADKINTDYKGSAPIFLGVLNGSFMFFGDLLKSVDLECIDRGRCGVGAVTGRILCA